MALPERAGLWEVSAFPSGNFYSCPIVRQDRAAVTGRGSFSPVWGRDSAESVQASGLSSVTLKLEGDSASPVHPTDPQEVGFLLPQLSVDKIGVSSLAKLPC